MNRAAETATSRRSHMAVACEVVLVTTVAVLSLIVCLGDVSSGHSPAQAGVDQLSHLYSLLFPTSIERTGVR
ncbi:hypothetical protein Mal4_08600 [Maioricimonas rarisocia]|uniref:Uncharacterized protein n=1 Tax=Maioricimonas rarisocia TaxID=2528026 RepID=A0A517Z267_9PLAN|nr:hypothetical protein Mal4_08600 [Maioricimonas rarisocia]